MTRTTTTTTATTTTATWKMEYDSTQQNRARSELTSSNFTRGVCNSARLDVLDMILLHITRQITTGSFLPCFPARSALAGGAQAQLPRLFTLHVKSQVPLPEVITRQPLRARTEGETYFESRVLITYVLSYFLAISVKVESGRYLDFGIHRYVLFAGLCISRCNSVGGAEGGRD